jgi:DNA uptake protein ComE-like DNA-binding protein
MNISHPNSIRFVAAVCAGTFFISVAVGAEQRQSKKSERATRAATPASDAKIDLNTASEKALAAIPVIGADAARAIVAARPFATIDELDRLKGISAERLEQIRAVVTVATSHVPVKVGAPPGAASPTASRGDIDNTKVDLNTSDLAALESIPSIGPETARAIVAARPFKTIDDLSRIKGVSPERLEQIRSNVKVERPAPREEKTTADPLGRR